ncbi:MAG: beta-eliminating lyase-related protein [Pyrinomonadaceae bacterium]
MQEVGGMRQVGVLAAAGLVALEETPPRLGADHVNARRLADGLAELAGIDIDPETIVTNILIFDVSRTGAGGAHAICARLAAEGVLASGFGSSIRMVTHYDVSAADIETTLAVMRRAIGGGRSVVA